MADNKITAELRDSFGKGAARKLRAAGKIPAVIYGHGTEPQHVALPGHEVSLIIRRANAVLDLDIAGARQLALVKDVQKDPVRQIIEHLDLIVVRQGERVQIEVAVRVEGESWPGTIVNLDNNTLLLEAEATHIPEFVTVDVEGKRDGYQVLAGAVALPRGTTLITDPDTLVVGIVQPAGSESEGDAEADTAEPDGAASAEGDANASA